jgi:hypothetical protein
MRRRPLAVEDELGPVVDLRRGVWMLPNRDEVQVQGTAQGSRASCRFRRQDDMTAKRISHIQNDDVHVTSVLEV